MMNYDQADLYYSKALAHCKKQNLLASHARLAINYCNFLLRLGKNAEASNLAAENLAIAQKYGYTEPIAKTAEILKKLYSLRHMSDSAFYFSEMQIAYTDSVSNQKKIAEFQNLILTQQLNEIEEQAKAAKAEVHRRQNMQYALIALGIILFILFFLLLIRRVNIYVKIITFLSVLALLVVFEFLNLLLHPFLERITRHNPILMLLALVCIAALLVPVHHRLQKWAMRRLVEKNKQLRLAAAKKIIKHPGKNNS